MVTAKPQEKTVSELVELFDADFLKWYRVRGAELGDLAEMPVIDMYVQFQRPEKLDEFKEKLTELGYPPTDVHVASMGDRYGFNAWLKFSKHDFASFEVPACYYERVPHAAPDFLPPAMRRKPGERLAQLLNKRRRETANVA